MAEKLEDLGASHTSWDPSFDSSPPSRASGAPSPVRPLQGAPPVHLEVAPVGGPVQRGAAVLVTLIHGTPRPRAAAGQQVAYRADVPSGCGRVNSRLILAHTQAAVSAEGV